ncbi:hypothetical protein MNBD_NITROSPINAE03-581, partial [hydrothermal vent metagenome]
MTDKKKKRDRAIYSPFISAGVIPLDRLKKLVDV